MHIPEHIFKGYDIRALVPEEMNEENVYGIAQAILHFFQQKLGTIPLNIVIGRDMRLSSPTLYPILQKALIDGGAHVIDIGLASTPTFYFAILHLNADAGIQLTASHNPPNYNGMKIAMRDGDKIVKIGKPTGILEIKDFAQAGVTISEAGGNIRHIDDIVEQEIDAAFQHINPNTIKPLKVVADPANAMAITYLEPLFKRLPCELITMNFELDGTFPSHQPDPLDFNNLKDLQNRVKVEKADLGIAPDGDGDRMFFIDENGDIVTGAQSTALVARELLKDFPGSTILFDIRYTMTPDAIVRENGGVPHITKVGHAYITKELNELGALYGGESSEHNFFKWTGGGESQIIMLLIILRAISESNKTLSQLIKEIRRSYESGEYNYTTNDSQKILDALKSAFQDGELSELDGISIQYPDWRCNIRSSNTEPLVRLNIEAIDQETMQSKLNEIQDIMLQNGAKPHFSH